MADNLAPKSRVHETELLLKSGVNENDAGNSIENGMLDGANILPSVDMNSSIQPGNSVDILNDTAHIIQNNFGQDYHELCYAHSDWLRIVGPHSQPMGEDVLFTLWAVNQNGDGSIVQCHVNIFAACISGCCTCKFDICNAIVQLKPC